MSWARCSGAMSDCRQQVPLPHVGIRLDRRLSQNLALGLSHVGKKLLMEGLHRYVALVASLTVR
jgi:hypothetical protein